MICKLSDTMIICYCTNKELSDELSKSRVLLWTILSAGFILQNAVWEIMKLYLLGNFLRHLITLMESLILKEMFTSLILKLQICLRRNLIRCITWREFSKIILKVNKLILSNVQILITLARKLINSLEFI